MDEPGQGDPVLHVARPADYQALADKVPADFTDVFSFTYLLFLLWLLYGPGPISLDWLVSRFLGWRNT